MSAQLPGFFNPADEPTLENRDPIPAGKYIATLTESEWRDTKPGGKMLVLVFTIAEGEHAGRKIWNNLNLVNPNDDAVRIARAALASFALACNRHQPFQNLAELEHIRLSITVKVRPPKDGYSASNDISAYEPLVQPAGIPAVSNGAAAAWQQPHQAQPPAQQQPAPAVAQPQWGAPPAAAPAPAQAFPPQASPQQQPQQAAAAAPWGRR